jgi:hypothetical protein
MQDVSTTIGYARTYDGSYLGPNAPRASISNAFHEFPQLAFAVIDDGWTSFGDLVHSGRLGREETEK